MKLKEISSAWYFLLIISLTYLVLYFVNPLAFTQSSQFFWNILKKILPMLVVVFVLMVLMNFLVTPKVITKHFKERKFRAWFFAIISGIISTGPIYMWYPLLKNAKEKGVSQGLIACFLYNRAIKLPFLPMIILYFGIKYVLILLVVMVIMSVVQGLTINKIMEVKK